MISLRGRLLYLELLHGGLRRACRARGIDPGYWHRLKTGERQAPSGETLRRLGLKNPTTLYEVEDPND